MSGNAWRNLLSEVQQQNKANNDLEATTYLLKEMQSEAWPKGLDTIKQLEPRKRSELLAKCPFIDDTASPTCGELKMKTAPTEIEHRKLR